MLKMTESANTESANTESANTLSAVWQRLRRVQPFADLSDDQFQNVLGGGTIKTCPDGHILVHQGDPPSHMFFVLEGQLRTLLTNEDGREVTLRLLDPGVSCMGTVLFMGGLSPVTVETVGEVRIFQLPGHFVKNLVLQHPPFATSMIGIIATNYRGAIEQIDTVTLRTPLQRIGHYLLVEHILSGSKNLMFELRFKKSLIASHLGMTPETLSRAFRKMRQYGITIDGQTVRLKDAFVLCHFCDLNTKESCPFRNNPDCPFCDI